MVHATSNRIKKGSSNSSGKSFITFGYKDGITAYNNYFIKTALMSDNVDNTQGYKMLRDGIVTGISLQFRCTSTTNGGSFKASVTKNGSTQDFYTEVIKPVISNNVGNAYIGSLPFSAGDRIGVELKLEDTAGGSPIVLDTVVLLEIE